MKSASVRRLHKWLFWLWFFPGLPVSIYLRNSIVWVMVLSLYTIMMEHALAWRQETDG